MRRGIGKVIFTSILGFFVFLVLLGVAKILANYIPNAFYNAIVSFFIDNLFLAFIIFFVTLIADIFWDLFFPFNIPAPIISALSSIFIVTFIYRLWNFLETYVMTGISVPIMLIYEAVFWIVLIGGYVIIIVRFAGWNRLREEFIERKRAAEEEMEEEMKEDSAKKEGKKPKRKSKK